MSERHSGVCDLCDTQLELVLSAPQVSVFKPYVSTHFYGPKKPVEIHSHRQLNDICKRRGVISSRQRGV